MQTIRIYQEDEIPWEIQNKIHKLLNISFHGKSTKFIAKTYANVRPQERVVCFENEKIVAHMGIHRDIISIGDIKMEVPCLGLFCSTKLVTSFLQDVYTYLENNGDKFAVGITNDELILKHMLVNIRHIRLNNRVQGKNSISKVDDKVILYAVNVDDNELVKIKQVAATIEKIYVDTEVF